MRRILLTMLGVLASGAWTHATLAQSAPTTAPATEAAAAAATDGDTTVARPKGGQLANYFIRLHGEYLERAKQGNLDVVFLGDSITMKWRDAPELFKSRYEEPHHAANFGIMGDVIQHVLWRVEHGELDQANAKVVVLLIGTNNSKRHDADPIFVGIKHLIDVIHQRAPQSKVLLMAIFPREKTGDVPVQMDNIKQVDAKLPTLDDGKMTRVLNINDKFYDAAGKFRQELFADGLHLNPAGYEIWADAMQPLLDEMLKP